MCTASLVKEMCGERLYGIAPAYCINKTILFPRSSHVDRIGEEDFTSLDRLVTT
jgi:hypothetical protein